MNYRAAAQSACGKVRRNNEDNLCVDDVILPLSHGDSAVMREKMTSAKPHLFGVFDGMGGYSDGETASYLAAATARKYAGEMGNGRKIAQSLVGLCMEANDAVCDAAKGSQMGTTCAMLCLFGSGYTVCNVGDSPIFLIREGVLKQISVDHNQRATYEKATGKPARPDQKFKLTQCIGIPKEEMLIEPYTDEGTVRDGDVFVLCSDGITDMLNQDTIREIVCGTDSVEKMASELTRQALLAGGKDNITVVCVKAEGGRRQGKGINGLLKKFFS